ncbi:MAG: amidase [Mycobacterium sp.]|nr:amidase [Mycobacterium sp.]
MDRADLTATDLARAVRAGDLDPVAVAEDTLARISSGNQAFGAFRRVRYQEAVAEAGALKERADLAELALAGVPIAVKDVIAVAGEYAGWGSRAGPQRPFDSDSEIVARLRGAGAVIVGLTRVPELCLWPMTDTAEAVVRNPWAPTYTAGGSSGGSAAAVAAGMVPLAHGTDALASLRSPAAICGLVGLKPGAGTVKASDSSDWSGMYTHGPLATTVSDAAVLLSVLAERPELAQISAPGVLRIATSVQLPADRRRIPEEFTAAVARTAGLLRAAGHRVTEATPHYGTLFPALLTRWLAGPGHPADGFTWPQLLEPRTRRHLRAGHVVRHTGLIRQHPKQAWIARAERFFAAHDVLVTPMLATMPPKAQHWSDKGWLANAWPSIQLTAFLGPWDLAGYPAMSIPAGRHPTGLPIGIQLVAPPGGESRLLALAAQLEAISPWPRTAFR